MLVVLEALLNLVGLSLGQATSESLRKLLPKPQVSTGNSVTHGSVENIIRNEDNEYDTEYVYEEYSNDTMRARIMRSISTSFVITIFVGLFPLGVVATVLVYLNIITANLCSKWNQEIEKLPKRVVALKFAGDQIGTLLTNLWFPLTMCVLFRLNVFKDKYMKALTVCLIMGLITILYKTTLYCLTMYQRKSYYNLPSNILFIIGVIYGSCVIAQRIQNENETQGLGILRLCIQFILGAIVSFTMVYLIIPWFNTLRHERSKVIATTLTPSTVIIPKAISLYFAQMVIEGQTNAERCFVLVSYLYGVAIIVFRAMQSDLNSLKTYTGLCVANGVVNVVIRTTVKKRKDFCISVFKFLNRKFCRRSLNTYRNLELEKRLNADINIQTMLCESLAIIICQCYFTLYVVTNYNTASTWPIFNAFIVRVSIAFAVDLFFNFASIFILANWCNVEIERIWKKKWRVHLAVSFITMIMTIIYFSPSLLLVVHTNADQTQVSTINNCSLPFT